VGTGRGGIKRFSSSLDRRRDLGGPGESQLGPCICPGCGTGKGLGMRELPSQVKETLRSQGLGSAGLRRLSRRGSWVRIPPPAPNTLASALSIALCGTGYFLKSRSFSCRDLFLSGLILGLILEEWGIIDVSAIFFWRRKRDSALSYNPEVSLNGYPHLDA
jgi:hypothetical protein